MATSCVCSLAGTAACMACPNRLNLDWTAPLQNFRFEPLEPVPQPTYPWWIAMPPRPAAHKTVIEEFDRDGKLLKRTTIEDGKTKEE